MTAQTISGTGSLRLAGMFLVNAYWMNGHCLKGSLHRAKHCFSAEQVFPT